MRVIERLLKSVLAEDFFSPLNCDPRPQDRNRIFTDRGAVVSCIGADREGPVGLDESIGQRRAESPAPETASMDSDSPRCARPAYHSRAISPSPDEPPVVSSPACRSRASTRPTLPGARARRVGKSPSNSDHRLIGPQTSIHLTRPRVGRRQRLSEPAMARLSIVHSAVGRVAGIARGKGDQQGHRQFR